MSVPDIENLGLKLKYTDCLNYEKETNNHDSGNMGIGPRMYYAAGPGYVDLYYLLPGR